MLAMVSFSSRHVMQCTGVSMMVIRALADMPATFPCGGVCPEAAVSRYLYRHTRIPRSWFLFSSTSTWYGSSGSVPHSHSCQVSSGSVFSASSLAYSSLSSGAEDM